MVRRASMCHWGMLALLAPLSVAAAPAGKPSLNLGEPRSKAIAFLNATWPERRGVVTGSCIVWRGEPNDPESWLYVVLPRSRREAALIQIIPDDPSEPAFANWSDLSIDKNGEVTAPPDQGGLGLEAVFEGGAKWIMDHRLTIVSTYAQAIGSKPTLKCPDENTMMQWRFGHRRHLRPTPKVH